MRRGCGRAGRILLWLSELEVVVPGTGVQRGRQGCQRGITE